MQIAKTFHTGRGHNLELQADLFNANVRPAIDALFRTDLDLKRSAGDPRILIERLIVELCAGKRVAARRW